MKGFNSVFRKTCGALLEDRGFKYFKFNNVEYHKVVNDVMHSIKYEFMPNTLAKRCAVYFGVTPLCSDIELLEAPFKRISSWSIYDLKRFTDLDECFYYTLTEDGLNACMEEISEYMTKYMFPFFDRADSCKTALSETINLEKFLDDVKATQFRLRYEEELNKTSSSIFLIHKDAKYFMALKNREYDYAIKHEKAILLRFNDNIQKEYDNISRLLANIEKKQIEPEQTKKRKNECYEYSVDQMKEEIDRRHGSIEGYTREMKPIEDELARLESHDVEYYNKMLTENEAKSREVLKELGLI